MSGINALMLALLFLALLGLVCSEEQAEDLVDETGEDVEEVDAHPGFSDEEWEAVKSSEEAFEFEAEVSRLMDIIINALYSNREIFLRELISNSADALDKIRFLAVSDSSLLGEGDEADLDIKISFDKDAKTVTITDRGIGMTKDELVKNLGVVAKSGTTEFVEAATGGGDALSLIGQFGVGFYSVYLVADRVVVASKSPNDDQYIWESTADQTFTVARDPRGNTLGRGTSITLHIKEDAEEFLNEKNLRTIVERYSEFVNFPIYLQVTKEVSEEVELSEDELAEQEAAKEAAEDDDELDVSEEDEDDTPKTKTVKKQVQEWERVNKMKAIWTRSPSEVEEDEYEGFYKALTKESDGPLTKVHFAAEGEISFRSLLFVPKKAPAGLYENYHEKSQGVKLYVRRVLISDEFDDFLPKYLNFVRGVVDSEDLPINVSRETLAQSRVLKVMSKKLVRKVLEMLRKMSEQEEEYLDSQEEDEEEDAEEDEEEAVEKYSKYSEFWAEFAKSIKLGLIEDKANKSKLSKLLRFPTNLSPEPISLDRYVDGMAEEQREIYYITGESIDAVKSSPFLESVTKKDYEVLFLVDPLDEYLTQQLTEYEGNPLRSVTKAGLNLGDDEKSEVYEQKFEDFTTWLEGIYGDRVEDVTISTRLETSPAIIVTGQYGWSSNMERIMKAQTFGTGDSAKYMVAKKTLEINPRHAMIRELKARSESDPESQELIDYAELIYDAALVQSGFSMEDTNNFASRIHRVVGDAIGVDPNKIVDVEIEVPEPEEEDEEDEDVEITLD
jgi:heat shock protein beta